MSFIEQQPVIIHCRTSQSLDKIAIMTTMMVMTLTDCSDTQ